MAGYYIFSAILPVQLLTALVLVSSAEALKCYNTTKACETETCSDDEPAASSSATFEMSDTPGPSVCLRPDPSFRTAAGIAILGPAYSIVTSEKETPNPPFFREIEDFLKEMNSDPHKHRLERDAVFQTLFKKVNSTEGSYPLCSRSEFSMKLKFPGKTFERSSVIRGCTVAVTGCDDFTEKSPSGNVELHYKNCRYEGDNGNNEGTRIGTTGVLALTSFFVVGIKGVLSMCTPY